MSLLTSSLIGITAALSLIRLNDKRNNFIPNLYVSSKKNNCLVIFTRSINISNLKTRLQDVLNLDVFFSDSRSLQQIISFSKRNYENVSVMVLGDDKSMYIQLFNILNLVSVNGLILFESQQRFENFKKLRTIKVKDIIISENFKEKKYFNKIFNNVVEIEGINSFEELLQLKRNQLLKNQNISNSYENYTPEFVDDENDVNLNYIEILSDLSSSDYYIAFNGLNFSDIKCYWKKGRCVVLFDSQFKKVRNGETFDEILFPNLPPSISYVINNRFFVNNEILKFCDVNGKQSDFQVDEGWIEIFEPDRLLVEFSYGFIKNLDHDKPIYRSRFRNIYAQREDDGENESLYFTIVNNNKEPVQLLDDGVGLISIPIKEELDDDWFIYEESYPNVEIPAGNKSVVNGRNDIMLDEFIDSHINLSKSILKLRNEKSNVIASPSNENLFFASGSGKVPVENNNFDLSNPVNVILANSVSFFGASAVKTLEEAFSYYGKDLFHIFYDFITDVFLVRIGPNITDYWNNSNGNRWCILYTEKKISGSNSKVLCPLNQSEMTSICKKFESSMITNRYEISKGNSVFYSSAYNPWKLIKLRNSKNDFFYINNFSYYLLKYEPNPTARTSAYLDNVYKVSYNKDIGDIEFRDGEFRWKVEYKNYQDWERRALKDNLISFFDGYDMYAITKSLIGKVNRQFSIAKYRGLCLSQRKYNFLEQTITKRSTKAAKLIGKSYMHDIMGTGDYEISKKGLKVTGENANKVLEPQYFSYDFEQNNLFLNVKSDSLRIDPYSSDFFGDADIKMGYSKEESTFRKEFEKNIVDENLKTFKSPGTIRVGESRYDGLHFNFSRGKNTSRFID